MNKIGPLSTFKASALVAFVFISLALSVHAEVVLPKIFSDNMMLQRNQPIHVWGWAKPSESVTVTFHGATAKTKADKNGNWKLSLKAMSHGGPYELVVKGKNTITLKNILVGDIWVGSGQSNMEWIVKTTNHAAEEIANGNHPQIRLFTVPKAMSFDTEKDLTGGQWLECNPETLGDFSAVAYFFGRKLNAELNVPIGLINSSWGGTNIQTWMSSDIMYTKDEYKKLDLPALRLEAKELPEKQRKYYDALQNEKGKSEKWYEPGYTDGWKKIVLPKIWEQTEIGNADGIVWFKKEFTLDAADIGSATLHLGPIDDIDETYLNGKLVGGTNGWNAERNYPIAGNILQPGKNILVVRVTDGAGGGGIYGAPEKLFLEINTKRIDLAGEWLYKVSVLNTQYGLQAGGPNAYPSQLYNAMIAPFISLPIKGVIWYQGEANTWEAERYKALFPELINNWRSKWNQQFPFLWVQLANFMAPDATPASSEWAALREAQSATLALPSTGQAVIIDIGEAGDIHPRNKQDVGLRLALSALHVAYNQDVVYSGPVYKSMQKTDNKLILTFDNVGSGLVIKDKYGYLKSFAIAGDDQKFVWAKAYIENGKVIVYHPDVKNPVAVRYAWGNNPDDANLYNQEGLPASPFRTDNWKP
ncbi:sialate O-acetylesterase [Ohtaekwangia koreensis]|uniref:Sialate O-acetylesterase n=1 Tax=Ohtaekwangia koreensis TaxID=688867 RepID=A0A1T5KN90_9BACT|nr:sialate O-acetylesterase [Ohtaekwangia koreensis]SKC65133.1 sialate O-acetylesterase [Ohtaekwangia koreensis]